LVIEIYLGFRYSDLGFGCNVMALKPSAEIVDLLKQQLGLNEDFLSVIKIWENELGPLARHAVIAGFKKGQVFIDVSSSAHMQELILRKKDLIKKINQHFGSTKIVKDLKLKLK